MTSASKARLARFKIRLKRGPKLGRRALAEYVLREAARLKIIGLK